MDKFCLVVRKQDRLAVTDGCLARGEGNTEKIFRVPVRNRTRSNALTNLLHATCPASAAGSTMWLSFNVMYMKDGMALNTPVRE